MTAQGSGGITIPGGVQERPGQGTQWSGLADKVVICQRLDLLILEVFYNLNVSIILKR